MTTPNLPEHGNSLSKLPDLKATASTLTDIFESQQHLNIGSDDNNSKYQVGQMGFFMILNSLSLTAGSFKNCYK
jgi:hypothetical protein